MRADRLLAELMMLQARGTVTARELAARLEVSTRTVYRDMYGLQVAGIPVVARRGRDGGFSLYPGWSTGLRGMSAEELAALAVATRTGGAIGTAPLVRGAVLKLAASLPAQARLELERLQDKILVDTEPAPGTTVSGPLVRTLLAALRSSRQVRLTIRRRTGIAATAGANPLGLVAAAGTWYFAWAPTGGRARANPTPDIIAATITAEPAEPPDRFDLTRFWSEWKSRQRPAITARVRFATSLLAMVEGRFGGPGYVRERDTGTTATARIRFRSIEHARAALLPWGGAIEVVTPPALRQTVADHAAQIVARYASSDPAPRPARPSA
jgi:predicted DNA-binding transcriptional regulator YafY